MFAVLTAVAWLPVSVAGHDSGVASLMDLRSGSVAYRWQAHAKSGPSRRETLYASLALPLTLISSVCRAGKNFGV